MTAVRIALARLAGPVLVFVLLGLAWQSVALHVRSILPPLGEVGADLLARPGFYASNLWATMSAALLGCVAGAGAALGLAVLAIHSPLLRSAIMPVALLLNVTPIVAISPALIVAFGFNATPHIIVAGIAAFFPMLINGIAGLRSVNAQALEVFRSMAATPADVFLRLRLPGSLPLLFAGARLSVTAAMIGSVVSEFMGTSRGIGATVVAATAFLNLAQMWAAIFVSAAGSLALVAAVGLTERLVVRW